MRRMSSFTFSDVLRDQRKGVRMIAPTTATPTQRHTSTHVQEFPCRFIGSTSPRESF